MRMPAFRLIAVTAGAVEWSNPSARLAMGMSVAGRVADLESDMMSISLVRQTVRPAVAVARSVKVLLLHRAVVWFADGARHPEHARVAMAVASSPPAPWRVCLAGDLEDAVSARGKDVPRAHVPHARARGMCCLPANAEPPIRRYWPRPLHRLWLQTLTRSSNNQKSRRRMHPELSL